MHMNEESAFIGQDETGGKQRQRKMNADPLAQLCLVVGSLGHLLSERDDGELGKIVSRLEPDSREGFSRLAGKLPHHPKVEETLHD